MEVNKQLPPSADYTGFSMGRAQQQQQQQQLYPPCGLAGVERLPTNQSVYGTGYSVGLNSAYPRGRCIGECSDGELSTGGLDTGGYDSRVEAVQQLTWPSQVTTGSPPVPSYVQGYSAGHVSGAASAQFHLDTLGADVGQRWNSH